MSNPYHRVREILENHGYTLSDLQTKPELIYEICETLDIQVSQFKDNRKAIMKGRGYKVVNALMDYKESNNGKIYMSYVNLGDIPIRSQETVVLAKALRDEITEENAPSRIAIEHGLTRNHLIHTQMIYAATNPPPKAVTINGKEYTIETEIVGETERWKDLSYTEQVKRSTGYHYKPKDKRGTKGHKRLDLKHIAYRNWYLEQDYIHSLSRYQRKKIPKNLAFNKNIKVKNDN